MIVDCHTRLWDSDSAAGAAGDSDDSGVYPRISRHLEAVDTVDRAIVLGFRTRTNPHVSNQMVADHVRRNSRKLVGFAGIDPTEPGFLDELKQAHEELGLRGVTLSPAIQDFHPADMRARDLYDACAARGMPIVFQAGHRDPAARLEFSRPLLLDEIAHDYPSLRLVIAHMGYPWVQETVVLLGKHRNVFADVAGLLPNRWMTYTALLSAFEYGVMDKLLFGSDFPQRSPAACIEGLYSINQLSQGTNLVTIPREQLRGIVERDALTLLGIAGDAPRRRSQRAEEDE